MGSYQSDRQWSDQFIPAIRAIVGPHLLVPASFEVDTKEAADLIVLRARDMTVACRIRRSGYLGSFGWQFTIRCKRDSGMKTELAKITEGWGDWMFYGFASSEGEGVLARWFLIDLHHWRAHMIRNQKAINKGIQPNGDGTSFAWFDVRSFPDDPQILIAVSEPIPVEPLLSSDEDSPPSPPPNEHHHSRRKAGNDGVLTLFDL